jgi:hypothetical protein
MQQQIFIEFVALQEPFFPLASPSLFRLIGPRFLRIIFRQTIQHSGLKNEAHKKSTAWGAAGHTGHAGHLRWTRGRVGLFWLRLFRMKEFVE